MCMCMCVHLRHWTAVKNNPAFKILPTFLFSFIGNTTLQHYGPFVSLEWGFIRHLRWRVRKVQQTQCYASLQKLLNNLQRGVVFSFPELWNFLWFTLWNEQCNKTTRTFASSLFLQNHSCPFCVFIFFFSFPRVLCCLLLVVKLHVLTSLKQTISVSFFLHILSLWCGHLLIFLHLIHQV